ncbi:hypothetical protein K440DRAFT_551874 [Wilcoxina mikolae CBS 423.85]|nr:hypothetical protein K440DRAFT_551874 [Wilcoxina mikolae CBS 423.85]
MADIFQESFPDGLTVVPVILGSDKIILSILGGSKSVWPVYLSIGNISKAKRQSVKSNGLILIGLLLRCPNGLKTHTIKIAYQESMATMLRPLEEPAKSGIKVLYADGHTRHAYSWIASFLADYPEQCNIIEVKYCWCPRCEIDPDDMPSFNRRPRRCHPQ